MTPEAERYKAILLRHKKLIWWLCFCYAPRDSTRCEDLIQEACIAIWEHFCSLNPEATHWEERRWVEQRTRDILRTLHRHHRRQPQLVEMTYEHENQLTTADDTDTARERVMELLSTLPEQDRILMQMRLDGCNAVEIGQALKINPNTVYQRALRIQKRLQKQEQATAKTKKQ
ncbi:MAG: sigma-70 family RNA polymerase sigma factor [Bacteroidales bacterium]|nr:sigma-70 family RNA polymerase sigma factor [Bacteroidales bacterium]